MGKEEVAGFSQNQRKEPQTLMEILFNAIDTLARRVVDFMPLGRGLRNLASSEPEGLIGWENVREIAVATLELQREKATEPNQYFIEQYQNMLTDAKREVSKYTGLLPSGLPEEVLVFNQKDWIDANISTFRFLFDPISEKYMKALEEIGAAEHRAPRKFAHTILSAQVGIIMGYLARNVLGQYDLSLPEPNKGGKLYIVESNVARIEQELSLEPRDFRQWITLHEVTHSFEFHSNSWLRDWLTSKMEDYLRAIDWKGMARPDILRAFRRNQISKNEALKASSLLSLVTTPEQRKILTELQAVMCVLEGYSNHVMDTVGKMMLPTYEIMKERFERRRARKSGAERLFQRLIGLELKLQQYKLGQNFVEAVVEAEGISFINRVWESAENMPDMDEIVVPAAWIERMKGF